MDHVKAAMDYFFARLDPRVSHVSLGFHGGGEPTLALDVLRHTLARFRRSAEKSERKLAEVRIATNGFFGKDVLDWLIEERIGVQFSLDGPADVHDRQRPTRTGDGSFRKVIGNIRSAVGAGLRPSIRAVVTQSSVSRLTELVQIACQLGVRDVSLDFCNEMGRAVKSNLSPPEGDVFVGNYLQAFELGLTLDVWVFTSGLRCLRLGSNRYCMAVAPIIGVTPEGHLSSCSSAYLASDPQAKYFMFGSIGSDCDVRINQRRKSRLEARRTENILGCKGCFLEDVCAGGCPARGLQSTGDLLKPCPRECEIAKTINAEVIARIADCDILASGRFLQHDIHWRRDDQPGSPRLRLVTLMPPGHPARDTYDPEFRPLLPPRPHDPEQPDFYLATQ
jgi:radical SAM protein with 4Fe4S-binding SPASM domain